MNLNPIKAISRYAKTIAEERLRSEEYQRNFKIILAAYTRSLSNIKVRLEGKYYIASINKGDPAIPIPFLAIQDITQLITCAEKGIFEGKLCELARPLFATIIPNANVHTSDLKGRLVENQNIQVSFTNFQKNIIELSGELATAGTYATNGVYNNRSQVPVGTLGYFFVEVKPFNGVIDFQND